MKNHFATFVSHKVAPLGIFLRKLNSESYLFARLDFSTQNLDSIRHFRYVSVRDFNFPKMAKFGIKISQIRPYNGTKKNKDLFGIIFWAKKFWFWNFNHFWPHGLCAVLLSKNFPSDPNWFRFQNHKIFIPNMPLEPFSNFLALSKPS